MKQLTKNQSPKLAVHAAQYQKKKQPNQNVAENLNRNFSKEDLQMVGKHMKRCSASLIIREMEIKTIMKCHFTPVRIAITKKSTNNKCWRGCGEKETLLHCCWDCKLIQPVWKTVWRYIKQLGIKQQPHYWAYTLRKP